MADSDSEEYHDITPTGMEVFFSEPPNRSRELVYLDDVEQLQALVESGYTTCSPDRLGRVALHNAIHLGRKKCFDILMNATDVRVNAQNFAGSTPLMYACYRGEAVGRDMVRALMMHPDINPFLTNNNLQTALHFAAKGGKVTYVKWLVRFGLNVDSLDVWNNTPLLEVLLSERSDEVKIEISLYLIRHGANVWAVNYKGVSVLKACISRPKVFTAILETIPEERLQEVNFRRDKKPLIWECAIEGHLSSAEALINLGFDFSPDQNHVFDTPVINRLISNGGDRRIMQLVYENTDKEQQVKNGHPPPQRVAVSKFIKEKQHLLCSELWFLSNQCEEFYLKPYMISHLHFHKIYKSMTLLSELLMTHPTNSKKILAIRRLSSLPNCLVSEDTELNSRQILPPLIAAALNMKYLDNILCVLKRCKATVRTRHCFALFSEDPPKMIKIITVYIKRKIFYLDDLFEDDLSILFEVLRQRGTNDDCLWLLLSLRLQHSPISRPKLKELRLHIKKQKILLHSMRLVNIALKDQTVRKLQDLARLSIKRHFNFVENDCRVYLNQKNLPRTIINFVIQGNIPELTL